MEQVFLNIWNRSFAAGWMILAVIFFRMLLKKAPKWTVCLLWGLVAVRLAVPFHIESAFSLLPGTGTVPARSTGLQASGRAAGGAETDGIVKPASGQQQRPQTGIDPNSLGSQSSDNPHLLGSESSDNPHSLGSESSNNPHLPGTETSVDPLSLGSETSADPLLLGSETSADPLLLGSETSADPDSPGTESRSDPLSLGSKASDDPYSLRIESSADPHSLGSKFSADPHSLGTAASSMIWMIGMVSMLIYASASFWLLKKQVSASIRVFDCVYVCDDLKGPFILGVFCPKIYLPSRIDAVTVQCVLVHEKTHLQRWDHVWKPFGFFLLSVYWFHPLCWAAYILLCRDIEYACDEKATKDMDNARRADYCQALLTCSSKKKKIAAYPVAYGEAGVKGRIQFVLCYRKPAFWRVAISLSACVLVAACFMTEPKAAGRAPAAPEGAGMQGQVQNQKEHDVSAQTMQDDTKEHVVSVQTMQDDTKERDRSMQSGQDDRKEQEPSIQDKKAVKSSQKIASITGHAAAMSREGYQEAAISYVKYTGDGGKYFARHPWKTKKQRDRLAQAALRELYTLTGYQLKECVYTTDGRSRFIFGKSKDAIQSSHAFYTRDYGYTLAGSSTPSMAFANARRVWYSDVQQLVSPYHDPQYQGHGAIPAWFLDQSGVYQGQKLKGFEAFGFEDAVYTHVKMKFDGGYYIVVTDDEIESAAEVSGPYFEADERPETGRGIPGERAKEAPALAKALKRAGKGATIYEADFTSGRRLEPGKRLILCYGKAGVFARCGAY